MLRLVSSALVGLLISASVSVADAQSSPFCGPGRAPAFQLGFAALRAQVGAAMGDAIECEHANPQNGDTLQKTTAGLAFYRKSTNTPTFTNGSEHWGLTAQGLVYWTGSSIDPPGAPAAQASPATAPQQQVSGPAYHGSAPEICEWHANFGVTSYDCNYPDTSYASWQQQADGTWVLLAYIERLGATPAMTDAGNRVYGMSPVSAPPAAPASQIANNYRVRASRVADNAYRDETSGNVILTQLCLSLALSDPAILTYSAGSTLNHIAFSNGTTCGVTYVGMPNANLRRSADDLYQDTRSGGYLKTFGCFVYTYGSDALILRDRVIFLDYSSDCRLAIS